MKWEYLTMRRARDSLSNPFLSRLRNLEAVWTSEKLEIPEDWVGENPIRRDFSYAFEAETSLLVVQALGHIRHMISPIPLRIQGIKSLNREGPEPDFLRAISHNDDPEIAPGIENWVSMDNLVTFRRLRSLLKYDCARGIDYPISAWYISKELSSCLEEFPGFFLCRKVYSSFDGVNGQLETQDPIDFALLIRQYGSKPEITWRFPHEFHDPLLWNQNNAIARAMRISPTHPAVILGMIDEDPDSLPGPVDSSSPSRSADAALRRLALKAEPSLTAIWETWELRQKQRGESPEPPPWLMVFGLIITPEDVTIVAHFPKPDDIRGKSAGTENASGKRFYSCIMDKIRFHPELRSRYDQEDVERWVEPSLNAAWISDRLRLFLALMVLVKNSMLVAAIWDDIDWHWEMLEAEDALEKEHAQWTRPTPTPSEKSGDSNPFGLSDSEYISVMVALENMPFEDDSDEEGTLAKAQAALEASRSRILEWRGKISHWNSHLATFAS